MRQVALLLPLYLLPLVVKQDYILTIFIFGFILAIQVVGLNIVFGAAGQLNMFQVAAFGIAGYVTVLASTKLGLGFWTGLALAAILVAIVSIPIGFLCMRFGLREFYFALITLAFAELARLIANNWTDVTNGAMGILILDSIRIWSPRGESISIKGGPAWYYFSLSAMILATIAYVLLVRSWIGRCFEAIRVNEDLALTLGINAFRYKLLAFIAANLLSVVSGALYAYYIGFIEPSYLAMHFMLDALLMLLLGGTGTVLGPVVGALILGGLPHIIELHPVARTMMVGAILILVILLVPEGIVGRLSRMFGRSPDKSGGVRGIVGRLVGSHANAT